MKDKGNSVILEMDFEDHPERKEALELLRIFLPGTIHPLKNFINRLQTAKNIESDSLINCSYSPGCKDCVGTEYCLDCTACSDCFLCEDLHNKKNYVFNTKCFPRQYKVLVKELELLISNF